MQNEPDLIYLDMILILFFVYNYRMSYPVKGEKHHAILMRWLGVQLGLIVSCRNSLLCHWINWTWRRPCNMSISLEVIWRMMPLTAIHGLCNSSNVHEYSYWCSALSYIMVTHKLCMFNYCPFVWPGFLLLVPMTVQWHNSVVSHPSCIEKLGTS